MEKEDWLLIVNTHSKDFVTKLSTEKYNLYKELSAWFVQGEGNIILKVFWDHINQKDNDLQEALLDQFETQLDIIPEENQMSTVRNDEYCIDISVVTSRSTLRFKKGRLNIKLYVYIQSLKKMLCVDEQKINIILIRMSDYPTF